MGSVHPVPGTPNGPRRARPTTAGPTRTAPDATGTANTNRRTSQERPRLPDDSTVERMVAEAAYYLAEKRSFEPGYEEADWLAAKEQIAAQFRQALNPLGRKAPPSNAHDRTRPAGRVTQGAVSARSRTKLV